MGEALFSIFDRTYLDNRIRGPSAYRESFAEPGGTRDSSGYYDVSRPVSPFVCQSALANKVRRESASCSFGFGRLGSDLYAPFNGCSPDWLTFDPGCDCRVPFSR